MSPSTPASLLIMLAGCLISLNKFKSKLACSKRSGTGKMNWEKQANCNVRRLGKGRRKSPMEIKR